ncbi:MAG: 2-amino-4-hydroxy-6-hydroxymethyldihydropteridine diphosphokinase [Chitinophagaceae bacterium]|nr:2-amino-4-hydroxy-6-hydroxymethyldihydropteridine diphosphokinase [Chitinophagaceae bacterium]
MAQKRLHKVYLSTGTNLGNRKHNLANARRLIEDHAGNIIAASSIYKTAPWGYADQPDFLNQVVEIETTLSPAALMKTLLRIEEEMGRVRTFKNASRVIDIDILFYDNSIRKNNGVIIPHPLIAERRFILVPMCELKPDYVHPVLKKNMLELLDECPDQLDVEKYGSKKAV